MHHLHHSKDCQRLYYLKLYPVSESEAETWYNFSAKNRVAHSTRKKLLVGIVDAEGDVTYYTIKWEKP